MNWDAIGAIGEIVGATAVVVTLVYFSMQLREVTKANQAQGTLNSVDLFSKLRTNILQNTDLASALAKANVGEELSEAEAVLLHILADELFYAGAVSYSLSFHTGSTYESAGEVRYVMSLLDLNPGLKAEYERVREQLGIVSAEFKDAMDLAMKGDA